MRRTAMDTLVLRSSESFINPGTCYHASPSSRPLPHPPVYTNFSSLPSPAFLLSVIRDPLSVHIDDQAPKQRTLPTPLFIATLRGEIKRGSLLAPPEKSCRVPPSPRTLVWWINLNLEL